MMEKSWIPEAEQKTKYPRNNTGVLRRGRIVETKLNIIDEWLRVKGSISMRKWCAGENIWKTPVPKSTLRGLIKKHDSLKEDFIAGHGRKIQTSAMRHRDQTCQVFVNAEIELNRIYLRDYNGVHSCRIRCQHKLV